MAVSFNKSTINALYANISVENSTKTVIPKLRHNYYLSFFLAIRVTYNTVFVAN